MSDSDSKMTAPVPAGKGNGRRLRIGLVLAGALVGGAIGGTGGLAFADGGPWHHGPRLEHIQGMVRHALDGVGATSTQEAKIHDIVASAFAAMSEDDPGRRAMRRQMIELLRAPTINRGAVEKLRTDAVAGFDAKSKTIVNALLDAADQLSPEQRTQLADRADAIMERHGGWGHRGERMERHGPGGDGPDEGGRPPEHGPDDGPDKG